MTLMLSILNVIRVLRAVLIDLLSSLPATWKEEAYTPEKFYEDAKRECGNYQGSSMNSSVGLPLWATVGNIETPGGVCWVMCETLNHPTALRNCRLPPRPGPEGLQGYQVCTPTNVGELSHT